MDTETGNVKQMASGSVSSAGLNLPFGTGLDYQSDSSGGEGFGDRWMSGSLAGLSFQGGDVLYQTSSSSTLKFTPGASPGEYDAAYFVRDVLSQDTKTGDYSLLGTGGSIRKFDSNGKLTSFSSPGGEEATLTYNGAEVDTVSAGTASEGWEYDYTWSSGKVQSIVYKVNGNEIQKVEFSYDVDQLQTVKIYENANPGGTTDWGTTPCSASAYTYHAGSGLLRHVIPPMIYRQMVNNGISDPAAASESELNQYAQTRYDYDTNGRVSKLWTNGGRYLYEFEYHTSTHTGGGYNVWKRKTVIKRPEDVREVYYLNAVGEVMLHQTLQMSGASSSSSSSSGGSVSKTWNTVYQRFENGSARMILSANDSAIHTVDESLPELVVLSTTSGLAAC